MSRAKTIEKFKKNPQNGKLGFGSPKVGISGGHPNILGAKMVLKTTERNFVKTVKISSPSDQALGSYLSKNSTFG